MEELLNEISKLLNVSVEGLVKTYPIIRTQFMMYSVLDSFMYVFFGLSVMGVIGSGICISEWVDGEMKGKTTIIWIIVTTILLIAWLGFMTGRNIVAPDWMLLNKFIIK